ncbi:ribonuclease P protein component [Marivita sp. GX14005]|uniref:ribonuclease P protein component n=1 Tax=Marivita sp. GX14005 TaxID=2942276 RepID=UPI00201A039E|nr:ribonuclease P protein component [Marivita sp. GX14005]MCL3882084.1 ribonuclease P protein component [Marivita sp. GX14005]
MTPPEAPSETRETELPAASSCSNPSAPQITTLRKRADFLRAARALRRGTNGMLVQARNRHDDDPVIRIGYTCSKKIGNAVARNRAKRRLRAVAHEVLAGQAKPGWDYVLIGRPGVTVDRPFDALKGDLSYALRKLHADR